MNLKMPLFAGLLVAAARISRAETEPRPATTLPTIFFAEDSTSARHGDPDVQGWGESLAAFFDPAKVRIENRGRGTGRGDRARCTAEAAR